MVNLLERFEDKLDRMVNGAFARAFKAEVQPVEIAAALQRELDDRAVVVDKDRNVVPNVFFIELSDHDYRRLSIFKEALQGELATMVQDHANEQHYTFVGRIDVEISEDESLETGIFRVRSEAKAAVLAQPHGRPAAAGEAGAASRDVAGIHPRLVVDGTAYPLVSAITTLGRGTDVDIRVDDPGASRKHCEIVLGQPVVLRDLNSTNGTLVDGAKVQQIALVDNSEIKIGNTVLTFKSG